MNETNSDIGEDEMEELNDDEVEEVIFLDEDGVDEAEEESGDEGQDQLTGPGEQSSPERDDAEFVFQKHTGPVFCCAIDPKNGNLAITGGEDDQAYVWEIQNGEIIMECKGHNDSVSTVSFNYDGTYVATGDMSGLVQVWKVATRALVWNSGYSIGDLSWLQWHHGTNVLLAAITTGDIVYMWKIPSGDCKVISGHSYSTDCGVIMPDGRRVAVGFGDGAVKVIELKSSAVQSSVGAGEAHSLAVSCLDTYSDNNIIATGGGDGRVNLFKTQPSLKIVWSYNCAEEDANAFIEAIGFSKDSNLPLLAAGTLNGKLYILDFVKQTLRHKCEQGSGICRLVWDRHSPIIFVGGLEGVVRIYDARKGSLQAQLLGHTETILDICLSTDGNTLLSTSDDMTCRVYAVSPPER